MFRRPLHPNPYTLPDGVQPSALPIENLSHIPGQNAAIRFFDPTSDEDLLAMRDILRGRHTRKWMDDTHISQADYREWAGTQTNNSYLFAVHDARTQDLMEMEEVRGFIYLYAEREEKTRFKRMERAGYVQPTDGCRYALEASFAVRPLAYGVQARSGLMSSALRQSCLQVKMLLSTQDCPEVEIFAFIDPENFAAHRMVEASGFTYRGMMKYDSDSSDDTRLYILDWPLLDSKMKQKLLETVQKPTETP